MAVFKGWHCIGHPPPLLVRLLCWQQLWSDGFGPVHPVPVEFRLQLLQLLHAACASPIVRVQQVIPVWQQSVWVVQQPLHGTLFARLLANDVDRGVMLLLVQCGILLSYSLLLCPIMRLLS